MLSRILILLIEVWLLLIVGYSCVSVHINSIKYVSKCTEDLHAVTDLFIVNATISPRNHTLSTMALYINSLTTLTDIIDTPVCVVNISTCNNQSACFCRILIEKENYSIFLQAPALTVYSRKQIHFVVTDRKNVKFTASHNERLPDIYNEDSEHLYLKVNEVGVHIRKDSCILSLTKCMNTIKYCCFYSPEPCITMITFNDSKNVLGSPCVQMIQPRSAIGQYNFSHKLCGVLSKKQYHCTAVHDSQHVFLKINNISVHLQANSCTLNFRNCWNTIQYCCFSASTSCVARIAFNNLIKVSGGPCAEITQPANATGLYTFSHTVCGVVASQIYHCRTVYNSPAGKHTLTVNDQLVYHNDIRNCEVLINKGFNTLEYCCSEVHTFCIAYIKYANFIVGGSPCAKDTYQWKSSGVITLGSSTCGVVSSASYQCQVYGVHKPPFFYNKTIIIVLTGGILMAVLVTSPMYVIYYLKRNLKGKLRPLPHHSSQPKKSIIVSNTVFRKVKPKRKVTFKLSNTEFF